VIIAASEAWRARAAAAPPPEPPPQRRERPQRRPHHRRRRAHHRRRRSLRRDLTKPDVVATKRRVEGEEILGPLWTSPNGIPTGLEGSCGLPTARPLASGDGDVVGGYVRAHARRTHLLEQSGAINRNQSQSIAISRNQSQSIAIRRTCWSNPIAISRNQSHSVAPAGATQSQSVAISRNQSHLLEQPNRNQSQSVAFSRTCWSNPIAISRNQSQSVAISRNQAHLLEQPNRLLPPATLFESSEGGVVRDRVGRDADLHAIRHAEECAEALSGNQCLIRGTQAQSWSHQRHSEHRPMSISRNQSQSPGASARGGHSIAINRNQSQSVAITWRICSRRAFNRNQSQSVAISRNHLAHLLEEGIQSQSIAISRNQSQSPGASARGGRAPRSTARPWHTPQRQH